MAREGTVPLGTWYPNGAQPLVLPLRTGMGAAAGIAGGMLVAGIWALVYSITVISRLVAGGEDTPDSIGGPVAIAVLGAVVGLLLTGWALWMLLTAYRVRNAVVEVGPRGIALLPGTAFVSWEQLSQVGVDVEAVKRVQPGRPLATRTSVRVVIALLPRPGAFTGRDLPDLTRLRPPEPYTHSVVVPQPGFGSDGRNIPVVRDLDAALRYFAPSIYAGVEERFSQRGFG